MRKLGLLVVILGSVILTAKLKAYVRNEPRGLELEGGVIVIAGGALLMLAGNRTRK